MEMAGVILVFNAGSSTLKFGLFDAQTLESRDGGLLENISMEPFASLKNIQAIGHRVVHGGDRFRMPTLINDQVLAEIERLSPLSPLHNPPALRVIEAARRTWPEIPHVAVFDTAFFAALPEHRIVYPLPYEWYADWGIRRFGFHGISHAYAAKRAADLLKRRSSELGVIICHLGNGCSATAVQNGKPVATSMGFTPMEGLVMGTRSGSVDPGILFYVMKNKGLTPDALEETLQRRSGLLGVSGISSDLRDIEKAAEKGEARAQLAIQIFSDRVRSTIGSLAVLMDRLDAVVFTAGIGEHSALIRETICQGLSCLGVTLDTSRNAAAKQDTDVSASKSTVRVLVIQAQEEQQIAREVQKLLKA